MSKSLSLPAIFSAGSKTTPRLNKLALAKKEKIRPVSKTRLWASYGLIGLNAALSLSYLFGVNANALKGYEMKKIQGSIAALTDENKKLSLKVSEATSIAGIQSDFSNSNFVPAGTAKFIQVSTVATAYKN